MRRREFIGLIGGGTCAMAARGAGAAVCTADGRRRVHNQACSGHRRIHRQLRSQERNASRHRSRARGVHRHGRRDAAGSRAQPPTSSAHYQLEGSAPAATIVGRSLRASSQLAALANGVFAHAMDYDLSYFTGQAIAALIPAILPVAETTGAPPSEILSAFIIGAEVCGRMFRAAPDMFRINGWHATGTVGAMAARRLRAAFESSRINHSGFIGITASLAGGVTANFGSMTKPLHAGQAARDGIFAVQLGATALPPVPQHSRAATDFSTISHAGLIGRWSRSRISARTTTSPNTATSLSPIQAAGSVTRPSTQRSNFAAACLYPTLRESRSRSRNMPGAAIPPAIPSRSRTPSSAGPISSPIRWCMAHRCLPRSPRRRCHDEAVRSFRAQGLARDLSGIRRCA